MLPQLRLTSQELQSRRFDRASCLIARQVLAHQGVIIIENAFAPELIEAARRDCLRRYENCFVDPDSTQALRVGPQRFLIPMEPGGPSGGPNLYANPFVIELIREVLGSDWLLGSFNVVIATPGADAQRLHRDHPFLFGDSLLDATIPPYAINVMVPLVDLTELSGTTRVWPTSHRVCSDEEAWELAAEDVIAPAGSCFLMDFRLVHAGTKNQSAVIRPLVCMLYNRPWFRDSVNYVRVPEMRLDQKTLEEIPADYRPWFAAHVRL